MESTTCMNAFLFTSSISALHQTRVIQHAHSRGPHLLSVPLVAHIRSKSDRSHTARMSQPLSSVMS
jgi:hypothetical protein